MCCIVLMSYISKRLCMVVMSLFLLYFKKSEICSLLCCCCCWGKLCIYILHCLLSNFRSFRQSYFFLQLHDGVDLGFFLLISLLCLLFDERFPHAPIAYFNCVTIKDLVQSIWAWKMFV